MAILISALPALPEQHGRIVPHHFGISGSIETGGEIVEELQSPCTVDGKIFVAVGKELKENISTLLWTLRNSRGEKICILHIHQPAQLIPMVGAKFPASKVKEEEVRAYRQLERQKMHDILNEYLALCTNHGILVEKVVIENDDIKKGIVELIAQYGIKKLVMGAAADRHHSKRMTELRSKKAIFVRQEAHGSCHIWFVCKGFLIYERESSMTCNGSEVSPPILPASPILDGMGQREYMKSLSFPQAQNNRVALANLDINSFQQARSVQSSTHGGIVTALSSPSGSGVLPKPRTQLRRVEIEGEVEGTSRSASQGSEDLPSSSNEEASIGISDSILEEGKGNADMYDQMKKAMAEATNAKREAYEESRRRQVAERAALEAKCTANESETSYKREQKKRKEIKELLAKQKQELENMKSHRDQVMEELRIAQEQKSELEQKVEELEQKIVSAVELLINLKNERDALLEERDHAVREAEELRKRREEQAAMSQSFQFVSEFSFSEIEEATHNFDPSLKVGEGGYGSVFRGLLRHTQVAIKMLHSNSSQGRMEFQQEVNVLSRMRHPNLVTLIGTFPEAWSLIYEYLPNGSLEDRLTRRDNTPPLSWQTRTRIAAEVCSALVFLHSNTPQRIVHGDLKPANILLDDNFVSKLGDFGIYRLIPSGGNSAHASMAMQYHRTNPKGTVVYMDPEFVEKGELTPMSDVYSFGIVLLRLLTGRPAMGIVKEVQYAIDKGNLKAVLDESAGEWPFVQAKQLAHLALRCCERNRTSRPDLANEVWRVLEPMRACCGTSSSFRLRSGEHCRVPSYFICPIFQEIMRDPHIAADGYTYEAEGLKAWLDSGHDDTSPMTNLKLAHRNLIPNHALRSAIQEWLHQP
uniref:RING-type E3 ubiquitin transferase n=1 Tax=Nelumbo nucifera TaxID=4432 RepID=A0A822ZR36_NELNU|nr:TPA_asm: hypothetical protein HUJ06_017284 [Nelumbo nucifera]